MREPTSIEVKAFWAAFQAKYKTKVIPKSDSTWMQGISLFLDAIGVLDKNAFMNNYSTTIHRTIYIPFSIGVARKGQTLWQQMVTCVHEHQHVIQCDKEGMLVFDANYLTQQERRALYEAEAYRCNMEMYYWRTKEILSPEMLAAKLANYGCNATSIKLAETSLTSAAQTIIKGGGITTEASKFGIGWILTHAAAIRKT